MSTPHVMIGTLENLSCSVGKLGNHHSLRDSRKSAILIKESGDDERTTKCDKDGAESGLNVSAASRDHGN
jgi:hypothetical protein